MKNYLIGLLGGYTAKDMDHAWEKARLAAEENLLIWEKVWEARNNLYKLKASYVRPRDPKTGRFIKGIK